MKFLNKRLMFPELREAAATCSDSSSKSFPRWFPPRPAAPAPLVPARAASRIGGTMLLEMKPNGVLLPGYFKARSIPGVVPGAIAWPAAPARAGALLGVVGGGADTDGERTGPNITPDHFVV